jgi:tape measure domain-containing protein
MSGEMLLSLKVTGDGKIAVTALKGVGDEGVKAGEKVKDGLTRPKQAASDLESVLELVRGKLIQIGSVTGLIAIAEHLIKVSDNATLLRARMSAVTSGLGEQKAVMNELFETAQRLELPFRDLATQFPRMAAAVQYFGGSTRDAIELTKILATTSKLAGKSEEEAAGQVMSFAQALEDGALQGREVRSMMRDNAPLARALAEGFGVTTMELKRMGDEGLLSSQAITQALLRQQASIEEQGKRVPHTVEGAWGTLTAEMGKAARESSRVNEGLNLTVVLLEKMRELAADARKSGNPFDAPVNRFLGRLNGPTAAASPAAPQISSQGDPARALAAAQGDLRALVLQSDTVSGINARFDVELHKLNDDMIRLRVAGGMNADAEKQYQQLIGDAYLRRRMALEALAQKGVASQQSEIEWIRKRAELEGSASANYYDVQQDSIKRAMDLEEYYHTASITDEREYINRKADLQRDAARGAADRSQGDLDRELEVLKKLQAQLPKAPTPTAANQVQTQIADQEARVDKARATLTITTRNLERVEEDRGNNNTILNQKLERELRQLTRDYDDYQRGIANSVRQLELEVDLIGKDEVTQAKARKELELRIQAEEKREQLLRQIKDLQKNEAAGEGDPRIVELRKQLVDLDKQTDEAIKKLKELLTIQFQKQAIADLSRSIADALMSGGRDGVKGIRDAFTDYFKKPIRVQLEAEINKILGSAIGDVRNLLFPGGMTEQQQQLYTWGGSRRRAFRGAGLAGTRCRSARTESLDKLRRWRRDGWCLYWRAVWRGLRSDRGDRRRRHRPARWLFFGSCRRGAAHRSLRDQSERPDTASSGRRRVRRFRHLRRQVVQQQGHGHRQCASSSLRCTQTENRLAALLHPGELETVQRALSGSREYNFGEEHGDLSDVLSHITKDRMADIIDAVMPGWGRLIRESQLSAEEVVNMAQALLQLRDVSKSVQDAITQISGTPVEQILMTIGNLDKAVSKAQQDLDAAFNSNDPAKIMAAQQVLQQAIVDRYQQEISMVRNLQQAIRQIGEAAYQFAISIAQRINSVGGSVNVAAIAMGRANELHGRIVGGGGTTSENIEDINGYVGAIDTWYQTRRSAIEHDGEVQQQAAQAIAAAQASAAQARQAQLQSELELAKQFQGLVDHATQMLKDLQLSSANPLSLRGRVDIAHQNVQDLLTRWRGSSGTDRINLGNELLEAIQTYRGLGQDAYQRPSPEWQAIYNEITADLTEVQKDSKTFAERQVELQEAILAVQRQAAEYQQAAAASGQASSAALEALNEEALGYYTWAQEEGARLYAIQRREAHEQLVAITGGMDANNFIAARQHDSVVLLQSIDSRIAAWLAAGPPPPGPGTTTTTTPPPGGGGNHPDPNPNPEPPIAVHIYTGSAADFMKNLERNAPAVARELRRTGVFS